MPETFLLRDLPRYECLQARARRYPELDVGAVEATLALMRVGSDVLEAFASHLADHGLAQGRFLLLMLLDRHAAAPRGAAAAPGGISPSELAVKIGVTRATVTGLLDGLERDRYIERRQHKGDRRALTVHLTEAGSAFLEGMLPDHYRRVAALMSGLDDAERRQLIELLAKVSANTDAIREAVPVSS